MRHFGIRNSLLFLPTRFDQWIIWPLEVTLIITARVRNKGNSKTISASANETSKARLHDGVKPSPVNYARFSGACRLRWRSFLSKLDLCIC